jgi:siroheme synthase-like protein
MADKYLPINISLKDRPCLVVGGGPVALRKIEKLIDYKADITVIASDVLERIEYYDKRGFIKLEKRDYKTADATTYGLVIAATDDEPLNKKIYDECHKIGIPVNVVDNPPLCDFIFPATMRRNHLSVSISSDGTAPFLTGHLRVILDNIFPKHWERISELAADFRKQVMEKWDGNPTMKEECYEKFLNADWKTIIKEQSDEQIKQTLGTMLEKD